MATEIFQNIAYFQYIMQNSREIRNVHIGLVFHILITLVKHFS
jgi:predicted NUDIX family phosphoesterase